MDKDQILLEGAYDQIRESFVVVYGQNYTGAHFRGFPDNADSRQIRIVVKGTEKDVVGYILDNFSYGRSEEGDGAIRTLSDLVRGYQEGNIPNGDGCGIVFAIFNSQERIILDLREEFEMETPLEEFIDLGEVNAREFEDADNDVNHKLRELDDRGELPGVYEDGNEGEDDRW